MPKFKNWSQVDEGVWENDKTGDRVYVMRPSRAVSESDEEWRVFLEGEDATERVGYPNVKDRMGIGKGESEPERGLITKLPRKSTAMDEARSWMKKNPYAGRDEFYIVDRKEVYPDFDPEKEGRYALFQEDRHGNETVRETSDNRGHLENLRRRYEKEEYR